MAYAFLLCMLVPQDSEDFRLLLDVDPFELDESGLLGESVRQEQEADRPWLDDFEGKNSWSLEWFPSAPVYRSYLADPLTPRSGSKFMIPIHGPDNVKIENALGAQRTFARWTSPSGDEAIDVSMEGAVFARFDINENVDMDAADFRVGIPIGYRRGRFSAKLNIWHLTSHLGDEFIERTGRKRIDYHKEEIAPGFSYDWTDEFRTYAEIGFGYYIDKVNKRWRGEVGAEWAGDLLWSGPPQTYLAIDIKWRQETDWDTAVAIQGGLWVSRGDPNSLAGLRFFIEYYRGVTPQTQFLEEQIEYVGLGLSAGF